MTKLFKKYRLQTADKLEKHLTIRQVKNGKEKTVVFKFPFP